MERKWYANFISPIKKAFGRYTINDPRPIAKEAPYTFYLPEPAEINILRPNDLVKLQFVGTTFGFYNGIERMWVIINEINNDSFVGLLDNDPIWLDQLKAGDKIKFAKHHIVDWDLADNSDDRLKGIHIEGNYQYLNRCLVDNRILDGSRKPTHIQRDAPNVPTKEEIEKEHQDSGWWIYSWCEKDDVAEYGFNDDNISYVALGAVLNKDDSWLHLIDSPSKTAYELDFKRNEFIRVDYVEPE